MNPESQTDTFAAVTFHIDNWRWADVPFYVRSGKKMPKRTTDIAIQFNNAPHAMFTTLLMSTGLTFGTITSLYGLNAHIIDRTQFSLLISVVVLSAIVPTAIAQRFFHPHDQQEHEVGAAAAEGLTP